MKIKIGVLLLILIFFLGVCIDCDYYFLESSHHTISNALEEKYFDINCIYRPDVIRKDSDRIEIEVTFRRQPDKTPANPPFQKVIDSAFSIFPMVYETGDTLKLLLKRSREYYFTISPKLKSRIKLSIEFNVDSAGVIVHKTRFIPNLRKTMKCRWTPGH